jgi:hypothetical protein
MLLAQNWRMSFLPTRTVFSFRKKYCLSVANKNNEILGFLVNTKMDCSKSCVCVCVCVCVIFEMEALQVFCIKKDREKMREALQVQLATRFRNP